MDLLQLTAGARVYDLSQPLENSIPVPPGHPNFKMALASRHGDAVREGGLSAAVEVIIMSGHAGTHIDALGHVSVDGRLHGGLDAQDTQRGGRLKQLSADAIDPIFCPGVLLDVAGYRGVQSLGPKDRITAEELAAVAERQGVTLPKGGAVLLRSGWSRHWDDSATYVGLRDGAPGPDNGAAEWLAAGSPLVTGHDNLAFEGIVPEKGHTSLPVHATMLVKHGIHLLENLNLEQLAADRVYQFLFVCLPLKVVGGTASPVRPIAVAFQ